VKITSGAQDRSAFPSFLHPYAVILNSPYANASPFHSLYHPHVPFAIRDARWRTDEQRWRQDLAGRLCRSPFCRSRDRKRDNGIGRKMLGNIHPRESPNEARNSLSRSRQPPLPPPSCERFASFFPRICYANENETPETPSRISRIADDEFAPSLPRMIHLGHLKRVCVCN